MQENSTVSVVIPVFDREELITQSLASVFKQTYRPIELIAVDDGSTDHSVAVVDGWRERHQSEDFRVTILEQSNAGAAKARNVGMRIASGEYISFLDSDDMQHPRFLEIMEKKLRSEPEIDCVICGMIYSDQLTDSATETSVDLHPVWYDKELQFGKEYWCTWNVLYKKQRLIDSGGWNEVLRDGWQDRELCLRLQLLGYRYIRCDTPLIICRASGSDKLSNLAKSKDPRFLAGITNAACSLSAIAFRKRQWGPLIWLLSRWFKWSIELSMMKLKAIPEGIHMRASATK